MSKYTLPRNPRGPAWIIFVAEVLQTAFTVGNFLYGRMGYALTLLGVFIVSGLVLVWVVNRLWK